MCLSLMISTSAGRVHSVLPVFTLIIASVAISLSGVAVTGCREWR